jgi:hypothetical protein
MKQRVNDLVSRLTTEEIMYQMAKGGGYFFPVCSGTREVLSRSHNSLGGKISFIIKRVGPLWD